MAYNKDLVAGGQGGIAQISNRAAFNGKGLTFVEIVFAQSITETATTPDQFDSAFEKISRRLSSANNGGTLLAQNYLLGKTAVAEDATRAAGITAGNSVDVYQFLFEGIAINIDPNSPAAITQGAVSAAITEAQTDILAEVRSIVSDDSTDNQIAVSVRVLLPEGTSSSGSDAVFGMFDTRA